MANQDMANSAFQRIAVIGLGRFGIALAKRLSIHGADIIAIDSDQGQVDEVRDHVSFAVRLDSTNEAALRSQEVDRVDCVVVAIGENFEAALLTTVMCKKNLKVPHVICRAQSSFHAEIFSQIGADEVIQPEQNAGDMLGRRLAHPRINDYITMGDGFTIVEMLAPSRFAGKSVKDCELRARWKVNLIGIRRLLPGQITDPQGPPPSRLISVPGPDDVLQETDVLLLAGSEESLANLPQE